MPTEPQQVYHIRHRATLKYAALNRAGARIWLRYHKHALRLRGGPTLDALLALNKTWQAVAVEPETSRH